MKFVSSLFLLLLLSVSVTARKRLTRGNIRDLDEGRRLETTKATKKSSKKSEAPSSAPSDSKMSKKGKSSKKNLIGDAKMRRLSEKIAKKSSKKSEEPSAAPSEAKMSKKSKKDYDRF